MSAGRLSINDRALSAFSATLRKLTAPVEYYVDEQGRKVRKPNIDCPVTYEETREFLTAIVLSRRKRFLRRLASTRSRRSSRVAPPQGPLQGGWFWITFAGAEYYKLPKVMGCKFPA